MDAQALERQLESQKDSMYTLSKQLIKVRSANIKLRAAIKALRRKMSN